MVWNGSCESCAENNIRSTPVAAEEAIEKLTPEGEGVAPNGWGDPASTGNGADPGSCEEAWLAIVFPPCGYSSCLNFRDRADRGLLVGDRNLSQRNLWRLDAEILAMIGADLRQFVAVSAIQILAGLEAQSRRLIVRHAIAHGS